MSQELNLEELSKRMREQQDGKTTGKKIVWDKESMSFRELAPDEIANDDQSPVNDVSKRPFFR